MSDFDGETSTQNAVSVISCLVRNNDQLAARAFAIWRSHNNIDAVTAIELARQELNHEQGTQNHQDET